MSQLLSILDKHFRANPAYQLILFDRLPVERQELFNGLQNDPVFYGVLQPKDGSSLSFQSVCRDTALLFCTMQEPGPIPSYVRREASLEQMAQLVLDGVLQIRHEEAWLTAAAAFPALYHLVEAEPATGPIATLSREALQFVEALPIDDPVQISTRLYLYNRVPLTPEWLRRYPSSESVAEALGLAARESTMQKKWHFVPAPPDNDGWFAWSRKGIASREGRGYKLYVSPRPEHIREAFDAAVSVATESGAHHFKIGKDLSGLLRPDKLVLYFNSWNTLECAASLLGMELDGCPAQGVPFTAGFGETALLSWGVDPVPDQAAPSWQLRESWRLWVTNRLAAALRSGKEAVPQTVKPWQFAIERLLLAGVDTNTWTPLNLS
jgi:hypothetical protein